MNGEQRIVGVTLRKHHALQFELTAATERIAALEAENARLKTQLVEVRANLETERVVAKDWRDAYNRRVLR